MVFKKYYLNICAIATTLTIVFYGFSLNNPVLYQQNESDTDVQTTLNIDLQLLSKRNNTEQRSGIFLDIVSFQLSSDSYLSIVTNEIALPKNSKITYLETKNISIRAPPLLNS